MINRIWTVALIIFLCGFAAYHFFRALDSGMEVDDLKSQIKLQHRELIFLQGITNAAFSSAKLPVATFEESVRADGRDVRWQGNEALVGPFKVKRNENYIVSIVLVGLKDSAGPKAVTRKADVGHN